MHSRMHCCRSGTMLDKFNDKGGNGGAGSKEKKKQKTAEAAAEAAPGNNAQLINDKEVVAVTVEVLVQELNDLVSRAAKQEEHARTLMRRT